MPYISKLISYGTTSSPQAEADRTKITNIMALLVFATSIGYMLLYYYIFNSPLMGKINLFFSVAYLTPLLLNKLQFNTLAKITLFLLVIIHIYVLCNYTFTLAAGFHLYLILVIPGVIILFNNQDTFYKVIIGLIAVSVIFVSEYINNQHPLIPLTASESRLLFQSTLLIIIGLLFLINQLYLRDTNKREQAYLALANTDPLTSLFNRRYFSQELELQFSFSRRYQRIFSLLVIDVDYFKSINDKFGHSAGDLVLKEIAKILKSSIRANDCIARTGGEEFAIILPETSQKQALQFAENLRKSIEQHKFLLEKELITHLTISVGICQCTPTIKSTDHLLECADQALYQAKNSGRNNTKVNTPAFE